MRSLSLVIIIAGFDYLLPDEVTFFLTKNSSIYCNAIAILADRLIEDTERVTIHASGASDIQFIRSTIEGIIIDPNGKLRAFLSSWT